MRRVRSVVLFCAVLTFLLVLLSMPAFAKPADLGPAAAVPSFSDVPTTYPYYQAIQGMAAAGVINGTGGGLFQPGAPVTRQQFAKMIVKSLGLTVTGTEVCPFTDVSKGGSGPDPLYPDKYVAVCAAHGITTGKTATTFAPYDNITRAQISTMMVRAAQNLEPGTLVTAPAWFQSSWGDFSPVHAPSANTAEYDGLFEGLQLAFFKDPTVSATRGEVAQLLWNLKNFQKQTKTGADLVTTAVVSPSEAPAGLQAALEAASGGEVEWIRFIGLAHPVDASVQVDSYYAVAGDKVFMAVAWARRLDGEAAGRLLRYLHQELRCPSGVRRLGLERSRQLRVSHGVDSRRRLSAPGERDPRRVSQPYTAAHGCLQSAARDR